MKTALSLSLSLALGACGGTEDAATVALPVTTAAGPLPVAMTDLGYEVQIAQLRIAVTGIQFTVEGESHVMVVPPPGTILHPGHSAGGAVTGELPGDFILTWAATAQPELGTGTLIVGDYRGANFALRAAAPADGLPAGDPLLGHTFHLAGTVTKAGTTTAFDAVLDVEPDTEVIGAVFEATIAETSTETLAIEFRPTDLDELDTPFDGIDFATLPTAPDGTIEIRPGSDVHNVLRRVIQSHDHYGVIPQ